MLTTARFFVDNRHVCTLTQVDLDFSQENSFFDPFGRPVRPLPPAAPPAASPPVALRWRCGSRRRLPSVAVFSGQLGNFFYDAKIQKIITRWASIHYACFGNLRQSLSIIIPPAVPVHSLLVASNPPPWQKI